MSLQTNIILITGTAFPFYIISLYFITKVISVIIIKRLE